MVVALISFNFDPVMSRWMGPDLISTYKPGDSTTVLVTSRTSTFCEELSDRPPVSFAFKSNRINHFTPIYKERYRNKKGKENRGKV